MLLRFSTILIRIKTSAEIQLFFTLIFYYLTKSDKIQLLRIHKYNKKQGSKTKEPAVYVFSKTTVFFELKKAMSQCACDSALLHSLIQKGMCSLFLCD